MSSRGGMSGSSPFVRRFCYDRYVSAYFVSPKENRSRSPNLRLTRLGIAGREQPRNQRKAIDSVCQEVVQNEGRSIGKLRKRLLMHLFKCECGLLPDRAPEPIHVDML